MQAGGWGGTRRLCVRGARSTLPAARAAASSDLDCFWSVSSVCEVTSRWSRLLMLPQESFPQINVPLPNHPPPPPTKLPQLSAPPPGLQLGWPAKSHDSRVFALSSFACNRTTKGGRPVEWDAARGRPTSTRCCLSVCPAGGAETLLSLPLLLSFSDTPNHQCASH